MVDNIVVNWCLIPTQLLIEIWYQAIKIKQGVGKIEMQERMRRINAADMKNAKMKIATVKKCYKKRVSGNNDGARS